MTTAELAVRTLLRQERQAKKAQKQIQKQNKSNSASAITADSLQQAEEQALEERDGLVAVAVVVAEQEE